MSITSIHSAISKSADRAIEADGRWMIAESAIVAVNDDPDRQHRIKVIIPSIDEDNFYDDWVRQMVFCMGNGYGSVFIPPVGSEVVLFGQLGQKYNFFYASVYNEEMQIAADFEDSSTSGFRVPGDFKVIADLDMQIRGGRVAIESDGQINITAPGGVIINGQHLG